DPADVDHRVIAGGFQNEMPFQADLVLLLGDLSELGRLFAVDADEHLRTPRQDVEIEPLVGRRSLGGSLNHVRALGSPGFHAAGIEGWFVFAVGGEDDSMSLGICEWVRTDLGEFRRADKYAAVPSLANLGFDV